MCFANDNEQNSAAQGRKVSCDELKLGNYSFNLGVAFFPRDTLTHLDKNIFFIVKLLK